MKKICSILMLAILISFSTPALAAQGLGVRAVAQQPVAAKEAAPPAAVEHAPQVDSGKNGAAAAQGEDLAEKRAARHERAERRAAREAEERRQREARRAAREERVRQERAAREARRQARAERAAARERAEQEERAQRTARRQARATHRAEEAAQEEREQCLKRAAEKCRLLKKSGKPCPPAPCDRPAVAPKVNRNIRNSLAPAPALQKPLSR